MQRPPAARTQSEPPTNAHRLPHKYSWGVNLTLSPTLGEDDNPPVRAIPSNEFRYHSSSPKIAQDADEQLSAVASRSASSKLLATVDARRQKLSMPRPLGGPRARRDSNPWDSVRKHPELWLADGDLPVYLYAKGRSLRGPSFKVHYDDLINSRCDPLIALVTATSSDSSYIDENSATASTSSRYELYLPVPNDLSRDEAYRWHLSTRNFFAWLIGRPLSQQDDSLGETLVELLNRLKIFRAEDVDNVADLIEYADELGYTQTANSPDRAVAMLFLSEHCEREDVWLDAFVHCVGMADRLPTSPEYRTIGRVTKALITRAYLEMDLHLERATSGLSGLLERELQSLGLGKPAANCLERFRSFLHSYYVGVYGYWPPPRGGPFDNNLYQMLREELEDIYHYLADKGNRGMQPAVGSISVGQHITAFNTRNKFMSLPFSYPLLPYLESDQPRQQAQRSLLSFKLGRESRLQRAEAAMFALHAASNNEEKDLVASPLVQAFRRFEEDALADPDPNISLADTRKVHWILIYGMLQVTLSITQAPPEVRDIQTPKYPLCCLTTGLPGWKNRSRQPSRGGTVTQPESPSQVNVVKPQQSVPTLPSEQGSERERISDGTEDEDLSVEDSTSDSTDLGRDTATESGGTSSQTTPRIPHSTEDAMSRLDPTVVSHIMSGGSATTKDYDEQKGDTSSNASRSSDSEPDRATAQQTLQNLIIPENDQNRASSSSASTGSRSPLLSAEQLSASPSFAPIHNLGITIDRSSGHQGEPSNFSSRPGLPARGSSASVSHDSIPKAGNKPFGSGLLKSVFSRKRSNNTTPRGGSPDELPLDYFGAAPSPPIKRSPQASRTLTLPWRATGSEKVIIHEEHSDSDTDFHDHLTAGER